MLAAVASQQQLVCVVIRNGGVFLIWLQGCIGKGVIKQTEVDIKKDSSNEDKSKYKLIKVGDIAYNRMRMWQGALGYSNYQGITSPAYVVLRPKMKINPRFFHFMFRTNFLYKLQQALFVWNR